MTAEPQVVLSTETHNKTDVQKHIRFVGGERWIRTTEGKPDRFTVCCHWPLGNLPIYIKLNDLQVELAIGIEPTTC